MMKSAQWGEMVIGIEINARTCREEMYVDWKAYLEQMYCSEQDSFEMLGLKNPSFARCLEAPTSVHSLEFGPMSRCELNWT